MHEIVIIMIIDVFEKRDKVTQSATIANYQSKVKTLIKMVVQSETLVVIIKSGPNRNLLKLLLPLSHIERIFRFLCPTFDRLFYLKNLEKNKKN